MSDEQLRMSAYYYEFTPTGRVEIDRILSAVATAGKSYHHTEMWADDSDGPSLVDGIQEAANEAASAIAAAREHLSPAPPAAPAERPTCATCVHRPHEVCQRFPPAAAVPGDPSAMRYFAWVPPDASCGEHPAFPAYIAGRRAAT